MAANSLSVDVHYVTLCNSFQIQVFRIIIIVHVSLLSVYERVIFLLSRNELDFAHTGRLNNAWNENQPIRVGRDGQVRSTFIKHSSLHFACI
jgi:hypothetical protein